MPKEKVLKHAPRMPKRTDKVRSTKNDMSVDIRRQHVLKLRMKWPPMTIRDMCKHLKTSADTIISDIKYLRTEFSSEYFAENNHAILTRVIAELRQMAYQFLSEAESLTPISKFAMERSALYGRALQAMQNCNDIMLESGIINKVPLKVETTGKDGQPIAYDVTTMSIEQRVAQLTEYGVTGKVPTKGKAEGE